MNKIEVIYRRSIDGDIYEYLSDGSVCYAGSGVFTLDNFVQGLFDLV